MEAAGQRLIAALASSILSNAELLVALVGSPAPPPPTDEARCPHPEAARKDAATFTQPKRAWCAQCESYFLRE